MGRSPTRTIVPPLLAAMTAPALPPLPLATLAELAAARSLSRRYYVGSSSRRGASLGHAVATADHVIESLPSAAAFARASKGLIHA